MKANGPELIRLLATLTYGCPATGLPCLGFQSVPLSLASDSGDGKRLSGADQLEAGSIITTLRKRTDGPLPWVCLICGRPFHRGIFRTLSESIWFPMFLSALSHTAVSHRLCLTWLLQRNAMHSGSTELRGSRFTGAFDLPERWTSRPHSRYWNNDSIHL